ncbi:hypothetical protein NEUTE2DRAFT_135569 [Neurospora tetrasperma FGSC 2509]|nr:hypothetical protein NEUTE2DRAFT_135569 [Neurospora tetrasperma FGSC 2509]
MEVSDAAQTRSPYHENRAPETSGSESSRDKTPSQNTTERMANIAKKRRLDEAGEAQVILGLTEADVDGRARTEATEYGAVSGHAMAPSKPSPMSHPNAQEKPTHILQSIEVDVIEQQDVVGLPTIEDEVPFANMEDFEATNVTTRKRSPRSPSPIEDPRLPQWKAETRSFKGNMFCHHQSPGTAIETAKAAHNGDLFVDGAPQFTIFCDGSSENTRFAQFRGDKGGYGVVFRDPYETVGHNGVDLAPNRLKPEFFGKEKEKDWDVEDFVILNWLNRKMRSPKRADRFGPASSTLKIFSDPASCQSRINKGILVGDDFVSGGKNLMSDDSNATSGKKRQRTEVTFYDKHTNPFVRAIVWQSHYLFERGCTIEIHWMPRNCTFAAFLADHVAGLWRLENAEFSQSNLAREERDGIMDKLSEEVNEIVRERSTPPPNSRPSKKRKVKRPPSKNKRLTKNMKRAQKKPKDSKKSRSANNLNARSFPFRPSPSPYGQPSSSQWVPSNPFPPAPTPSVSEPFLRKDHYPSAEHRVPTLDTFPTWLFRDPTPPRMVRAPTPGRYWEIEDENEIEVGIVRNEEDRLREMDSEDEKKEEEQDNCSGKDDEKESKE